MSNKSGSMGMLITICSFVFIGLVVLMLWGCPTYGVWSQEMKGRAELARAEQNKQILMIEAEAMLAAERFNAESEIIRAQGMAEAIAIENGQLTDRYILYLWVRTMAPEASVIYIPTEAGLPILEARNRE